MNVRAETGEKGPRIELLSHKDTITSGNGAKWAGGMSHAMRPNGQR